MTKQADINFPNLNSKTGIVFDPLFLQHTQATHPERALRLVQIMEKLKSSGLNETVSRVPSRDAELNEIRLNHEDAYIERVKQSSLSGSGNLDPDTYFNSYTFDAAIRAAGSLITLTSAVVDLTLTNGFALLRPPGHHAMAGFSMGFCLFNNIAIAAKAARKSGVGRIAIVDFDVHHGNGTQASFESDPSVLFLSSHQYPHWPGTGRSDETGLGAGQGSNVNIPFSAGAGDVCFQTVYSELVFPIIRRFDPDLMLVSAGYDAHWADPLAGLSVTCAGHAWISEQLVQLAEEVCSGKIVFCLEGGYHTTALSAGVANSIRALLKRKDYEDPLGEAPGPEPDCADLIAELKRIHGL